MFELKKSEIKKAERVANKKTGKRDCRVTGYTYKEGDDENWISVICEVCSNDMTEREQDVMIHCFIPDRRRSFAI